MIRRSLCAVALLAGFSAAAPTLTTIQDVLYKADGTRFNGTLSITWNSFQTADNSAIVMQTATVKVIDGNLRVQLAPSTTGDPAIVYSVTYNTDGRVQFQENWSVPPSTTPLRIRDVRVAASAGSSTSGGADTGGSLTGPIPESQVTGLIADLGARPTKGPGFAAGRTAIVDASGLVETATGNPADCVHVDGSSGPCGSGGSPTFVDGDSPSGIVDGSNATFALAAVPAPSSSLSVYRNGMLQKPGVDYTASGNSIQFVTGAIPQPGDTLLAGYRTSDSSGNVTNTFSGFSTPQVICSGTGAGANAATLTSLATCMIPAGLLSQGDRIEIRFDYSHSGTAGGFSIETHWGATTITHRDAPSTETLATGRADAGILAASAQLSAQTWGSALTVTSNVVVAADTFANGLNVDFRGSVANGGDTVTLNNFAVVRIP
jgi:hypothetical protein